MGSDGNVAGAWKTFMEMESSLEVVLPAIQALSQEQVS
jgi:hypothetical protein